VSSTEQAVADPDVLGRIRVWQGVARLRPEVDRTLGPIELLSLTGRTRLFTVAYQLFLEHPFFGHGYHAARGIFLEQVHWAGHSHNVWVETAVNTGAVGLILVTLLVGLLVAR
jgi:O-antigen ligase